jgi:hypothetical protein
VPCQALRRAIQPPHEEPAGKIRGADTQWSIPLVLGKILQKPYALSDLLERVQHALAT